ncbi:MAG: ATP-binding protein, partial [Muribaculaceae bacterium]|nr:ATP-binding protein [Muribaculaceae bacterium]
ILQPIVENAILHGFVDRVEGAMVTVSVQRISEDILITVSDNGCGMPPDTLRLLVDKINSDEPASGEVSQHTSVGMRNVNRRIKLHFGPQYGVTIYSCPDVGTDVELRIPYRH